MVPPSTPIAYLSEGSVQILTRVWYSGMPIFGCSQGLLPHSQKLHKRSQTIGQLAMDKPRQMLRLRLHHRRTRHIFQGTRPSIHGLAADLETVRELVLAGIMNITSMVILVL